MAGRLGWRDALHLRFVPRRADSVADDVQHDSSAQVVGVVFVRRVNRRRVVEGGLAGLQFEGDRVLELLPLFVGQDLADRVHVAGQAGDRQQVPVVAAGDVLQAAVVGRAFVGADPAGQVRHRLRSRHPGARRQRLRAVPACRTTDRARTGPFRRAVAGRLPRFTDSRADREIPTASTRLDSSSRIRVCEAQRNTPSMQTVRFAVLHPTCMTYGFSASSPT